MSIYTKSNFSTARRNILGSSWFSSRLDYIYIRHSAHHKGCSNKQFGPGPKVVPFSLSEVVRVHALSNRQLRTVWKRSYIHVGQRIRLYDAGNSNILRRQDAHTHAR